MNQIDIFGGTSEIAPGLARLLEYVPGFFDEAESHSLFEKLKSTIEWKQETLALVREANTYAKINGVVWR